MMASTTFVQVLAVSLLFSASCSGQDAAIGWGRSRLVNAGGGHKNNGGKSLLTGAGAAATCADVESLLFDKAVVDNFASADEQEYWSQRYWLNKKNWAGPGSPIFVFIGGEGAEACGRLAANKLYLYQLAQEHNALLVDVEHRFYGESVPTKDVSTHSLRLLSAEQAMADLARIITQIKTDLNTLNSKVITVGGSYPGNLAAYFRLKYPSVTQGSIASSAPLTAKTDFSEYMDVVAQSLEHFGGQTCVDAFAKAAASVADLFEEGLGSKGMSTLEKDFNTCNPILSNLDLAVLLSDLMGNVQGTIQYNNERSDVLNAADICSVMTSSSGDAYTNFVTLSAKYREANGQKCEDASFSDTIALLGNTTLSYPANAARSWVYQTCNEFGYFQTATSPNQPFHRWGKILNVPFSLEICRGAYDNWSVAPNVAWTNTLYGGVSIDASNIVFTSGTIDPWHSLGVTNFTGALPQAPTSIPVYIAGTAHCADLAYPNPQTDPETLTFARQVVAEKLREYLA